MKSSWTLVIAAIVLFGFFSEGWEQLAGARYRDTANLMQGLSIATEVKHLISERWAMTGDLPCDDADLDFGAMVASDQSVLSAVDVTGCGEITLLYNEASGLAGRRMVLTAEELNQGVAADLVWRCWTPDFPNIAARIPECEYEDRQMAAVNIPADSNEQQDEVVVSAQSESACQVKPAIYRAVFTDGVHERRPRNRLVSYGTGRDQMVFFTEIIGADGKEIVHKWFFDGIEIAQYAVQVEADRWPTWSTQAMRGVDVGKLRVDVYDQNCLIGQAAILLGGEQVAESTSSGGWMRPDNALEFLLAKKKIDYASTVDYKSGVNEMTDNGDTLLLAAIRRGDTDEAMILINRQKPPADPPREFSDREVKAYFDRYYRRADPFLRDAAGVSPIELARKLGNDTVVEALIRSAITVHRDGKGRSRRIINFDDSTLNKLLFEKRGFMRFDDGDTPLLRAVRTNNERAVLTMLRLPGWNEKTDTYNPPVDIYAYDADGRQALQIAREKGFYAIDRFLSLAMTRKSPGWAVSRAAFTTRMQGSEPGDCRKAAFEDESRLHFFTELSAMHGKRVTHEWLFNNEPVHHVEFEVTSGRWSTHSSRDFSPADIGLWDVRAVTENGEVLHTERLSYKKLTEHNRKNRDRMLGSCNVGASAFSALVKANAPMSELEYLVAKGTVVKPRSRFGRGLLSRAIVSENIPFVSWLLDNGLDIEEYVDGAASPLLLAVKEDGAAMTLFLLTRGADIGFGRSRDGQTALHLGVNDGNLALIDILLERGADPNRPDDGGHTALHRSVGRCNQPVTQLLLDFGADPELTNKQGETSRDRAENCEGRESWIERPMELASSK